MERLKALSRQPFPSKGGQECLQFSSVAQSCPTPCDPMNRSTPGLPVHHHLPEFTQTHVHRVSDAIQPSQPLSSPSPPAPNPSQHQSLFQWVNSSHEVTKWVCAILRWSGKGRWHCNEMWSWWWSMVSIWECSGLSNAQKPWGWSSSVHSRVLGVKVEGGAGGWRSKKGRVLWGLAFYLKLWTE